MRATLRPAAQKDGVATLKAALEGGGRRTIEYATRTGALLRINGIASGAFDREHPSVTAAVPHSAEIAVEVELRALPTNGLPSGPGLRWWLMNLFARQRPSRTVRVTHAQETAASPPTEATLPLIGHSHLDVAWLWTYEEARRKATRTFAIALNLLDRYPHFLFVQSQPQLYAFVRDADPILFDRVRGFVEEKRFDASVAALWVEADCNLPSGESLLRQMLFAHRFCIEHFNQVPEVAWLPDSFGFANTLPTLLAHAGIRYFVTTKLQWNDTTRFPYPQFRWRGPDGSEVIAALIDSYDGPLNPWRIARARERREPVIAGYGDGGGGVTQTMIAQARSIGKWTRPIEWLRSLRSEQLPTYTDELYLEYHRGVFTSHHDVKQRNARLERRLAEAEEAVSRCVASRLSRASVERWRSLLNHAWELLLRNQFHDVLPGTSIAPVYADAHAEYASAEEAVGLVLDEAYALIEPPAVPKPPLCVPRADEGRFNFSNGLLEARVLADGSIEELRTMRGRNVVSRANVLTLYRDRPRQWDAWNIDDGYQSRASLPQYGAADIRAGALIIPLSLGRSRFELSISLAEDEPFLRINLHGDWRERHTLLRCENHVSIEADAVIFGTPHGTIERSAFVRTPQERAKFEVPGQRFALLRSAAASLAMLTLDTYGWSARRQASGVDIGHSLLRAPMWPHADADAGAQQLSYALAPLDHDGVGRVESLWQRFARQPSPQLFWCDDAAVSIVACKPAQDSDGIILRVRECDGQARDAEIRCAHPVVSYERTDALERRLDAAASAAQHAISVRLQAFELQSYRVRF